LIFEVFPSTPSAPQASCVLYYIPFLPMPPKRKAPPKDEDHEDEFASPTKKAKVDPSPPPKDEVKDEKDVDVKKVTIPAKKNKYLSDDEEELSSNEDDDTSKPWCNYGIGCYRYVIINYMI